MALKYDPEWQAAAAPLLEIIAAAPVPADHDVESRRAGLKALLGALYAALPQSSDIESSTHSFKSYDGAEIVIYRHKKKGEETAPGPAIYHIHGGGMIAGSAEDFGIALKVYVELTGVQAFDVEYRLAPEFPDPTPVEDCYAGLQWLHEHAAEFGVDKTRIGVMGESAGGGLAAGVSLLARDRALQPPLAKSILIYPMLDSRNVKPLNSPLEKFLFWTVGSNVTGWKALLGDKLGSADVSPYASPAHVKSVEGLPPTYIDTGSLDLFRDEDIEYTRRLAAANNDVEFHLYPGVPHGFEIMGPTTTATQRAQANRLKAIRSF